MGRRVGAISGRGDKILAGERRNSYLNCSELFSFRTIRASGREHMSVSAVSSSSAAAAYQPVQAKTSTPAKSSSSSSSSPATDTVELSAAAKAAIKGGGAGGDPRSAER